MFDRTGLLVIDAPTLPIHLFRFGSIPDGRRDETGATQRPTTGSAGQRFTRVCPTWRGTTPAKSSSKGTTATFTMDESTAPLAGTGLGVRFPKGKWAGNFRNRPSPLSAYKHGVSA